MTKLVVTIAALQLVEQSKLALDDAALIDKHLPELTTLDIVTAVKDGKPEYTKRTERITLRHLLTHTNGTGYGLMVPVLGEWGAATGHPGPFGKNPNVESFSGPLVFNPGQGWNYSLGLDWTGILIERVTGKSLEDYFQENIFKPVGAKTLTFVPTQTHYDRMQAVTTRTPDGKLVVFPGIRDNSPEALKGQASGGAGLFGTARDYLRVLQGVLASGKPGGILSPESVKLIFTDQLPKAPAGTYDGQLQFAALIEHIHPDLVSNKQLTHSLGGFVSTADSGHGRKAGSDWWEGILKTFYWMDPTTGIAVSEPRISLADMDRASSPPSCSHSVFPTRPLTRCSTSSSAPFTTICSRTRGPSRVWALW